MLRTRHYAGRTMSDAPETDPAQTPVEGRGPADDVEIRAPRPVVRSVLVGIALAVGLGAITFFLIAIPFYTLASFEPNGINRPIVRTGLFRIALPVGALVGVVGGAVAGRWLHRGGRWVVEDGRDRYSSR